MTIRMSDGAGKRREPWFGPKRFGVGIGPRTWQGWVIVVLGAGVLVLLGRVLG